MMARQNQCQFCRPPMTTIVRLGNFVYSGVAGNIECQYQQWKCFTLLGKLLHWVWHLTDSFYLKRLNFCRGWYLSRLLTYVYFTSPWGFLVKHARNWIKVQLILHKKTPTDIVQIAFQKFLTVSFWKCMLISIRNDIKYTFLKHFRSRLFALYWWPKTKSFNNNMENKMIRRNVCRFLPVLYLPIM